MILGHFFLKDRCSILRAVATVGLVAGVVLIFEPQNFMVVHYEVVTWIFQQWRFFSTSLSTHFSSCQTFFMPLISTPTGFNDCGLLTRWAQLLTFNYYLPRTWKDRSTMRSSIGDGFSDQKLLHLKDNSFLEPDNRPNNSQRTFQQQNCLQQE